jgi:hypothetical protein
MDSLSELEIRPGPNQEQAAQHKLGSVIEKMRRSGRLQREVVEGIDYYYQNRADTGFTGVHLGTLSSRAADISRLATVAATADERWCVIYDPQNVSTTSDTELTLSLAEEYSHMTDMDAIFRSEGRARAMTHAEVAESEIKARTFVVDVYEELKRLGHRYPELDQPLAEVQRIRLMRATRMLSEEKASAKIREVISKHLAHSGYNL